MAYRRRSFSNRGGRYRSNSSAWKSNRNDSKSKTSLIAYTNPFSVASATPKIPDGKSSMSCGNRCFNVQPVKAKDKTPMLIFLYAGYGAGTYIRDDDRLNLDYSPNNAIIAGRLPAARPADWDVDDTEAIPVSTVYRKGRVLSTLYSRHPVIPQDWKQDDNVPVRDDNNQGIKKWRVVSQATRVMLTNNFDNNEGWFEAIRVAPSPQDFNLIRSQGFPPAEQGVARNTRAAMDVGRVYQQMVSLPNTEYKVPLNLVENPSYTTGRLRDIGKYVFQLLPLNGEHEFKDPIEDTRNESMLVDDSFDMIVIKLHIKKQTDAQTGSALVVSTVCNQEHIYDESNPRCKFHTECFKDLSGLSRAKSILGASQKAGKRLLGS
jgi:hypothetical protein